ncbi:hypothetical protein BXZ70DRAFT_544080 [Cristinia sonorae]|uniref:Uncharacterized protein n=1 Tax=Cristinia sonorae TaxID=1940300 RepID=A0A8K0UIA1_9AGAR|nr:hypothetical protein BXZ70DRAFT_544080 [Cristinia sonorae]
MWALCSVICTQELLTVHCVYSLSCNPHNSNLNVDCGVHLALAEQGPIDPGTNMSWVITNSLQVLTILESSFAYCGMQQVLDSHQSSLDFFFLSFYPVPTWFTTSLVGEDYEKESVSGPMNMDREPGRGEGSFGDATMSEFSPHASERIPDHVQTMETTDFV